MSGVESTYLSFADWLNKQASWLQDAVWRIYNRQKMDESQIRQYAEMCLAEGQGRKDYYYYFIFFNS